MEKAPSGYMRTFSMLSRLLKRVYTLIFGFLLIFSHLFSILIVLSVLKIAPQALQCTTTTACMIYKFFSFPFFCLSFLVPVSQITFSQSKLNNRETLVPILTVQDAHVTTSGYVVYLDSQRW